jgi:hypothetical protein
VCKRRRIVFALLLGAAFPQALKPLRAQPKSAEFLTEYLEYVAWDGSHWSVRRDGAAFLLVRRGGAQSFPEEELRYRGWDGGNWSARWSGDAFLQVRDGAARALQEPVLSLLDWQGRKWSARWDGTAQKFRLRSGG